MHEVSSHRPKNHVVDRPKKGDLSTEPDLDFGYSFSTSVKFPVLLLKINRHFDQKLWLLRGFRVVPQGLEDGKSDEKLVRIGTLQMIQCHIGRVPPHI